MDEIRIDNLEVYAYHGVYPEENKEGQPFYINAVLYTDTAEAGRKDDLTLSTNYGEVCHFINDWMEAHTCKLNLANLDSSTGKPRYENYSSHSQISRL